MAGPSDSDIVRPMEKSLFRYIWPHSKRDQLIVCAVVLAVAAVLFRLARPAPPDRQRGDPGRGLPRRAGDRALPQLSPRTCRTGSAAHSITIFDGFQVDRLGAALRPLGAVPVLRPHQRRVQVLDQRRQGRARRAHAAADALRPVRPGAAVHAGGAANGQVVGDGDHHQGRGRADRRLHRRRLHHAGLPRHAGADGSVLHHGAERLARPDGGWSWSACSSPSSRACGANCCVSASSARSPRANSPGASARWSTASRPCTSTIPTAGSGPRSASGCSELFDLRFCRSTSGSSSSSSSTISSRS